MSMAEDQVNKPLVTLFLREIRERSHDLEQNLLRFESATHPNEREELREKLMRLAHSLKGAAGLLSFKLVEDASHMMEEFFQRGTGTPTAAQMSVLLSATDAIAEAGSLIEKGEKLESGLLPQAVKRLSAALRSKPRSASRKKANQRPDIQPPDVSDGFGIIRVPVPQIDSLLYQSGEILGARALTKLRASQAETILDSVRQLRQTRSLENDVAEELYLIESNLRDLVRQITDDNRRLTGLAAQMSSEIRNTRMQPISLAYNGLGRAVRDMSEAEKKVVDFKVSGEETEVDRSILGSLNNSLRHLVRNAVVHGIEAPAERKSAGKPAEGRITVDARVEGESLSVTVSDDGRGIDVRELREQAPDISAEHSDDHEFLRRVLFMPGISTSPTVTRHSGRGVGLDVVRSLMERLRGDISVETHEGKGASFTLTMPLSLATARSLILRCGDQAFALELLSVSRLANVRQSSIIREDGRLLIEADGRRVPALDLRSWLGLPPSRLNGGKTAVILNERHGGSAVLVDSIAGEQELLVRPLGPRLEKVRGFSGGALLPEGRVALFLNALAINEAALERLDANSEERPPAKVAPRARILVVDDNPAIRSLGQLILTSAGYEVSTASNGTVGWDHLLAYGADLVIADVDMPDMNGLELVRMIRADEKFRHLPVILVTARDTPHDKARGLEAGADAYIAKSSFDQEKFIDMIRTLV